MIDINSNLAAATEDVKDSLSNLADDLGCILIDHLRQVDANFNFMSPVTATYDLDTRFMLMLDKNMMPESNKDDSIPVKNDWVKFAATASAYIYKNVGESVSKPLRKWLANAASAAILAGLLAEVPESCDSDERTTSDGEASVENISTPDRVVENRQDGAWYYGCWTVDNLARSCEMMDVIDVEMIDACIRVMIAAVVNYFQENRFAPCGLLRDSYASAILRSDLMDRYGLTDEHDKIEAMCITGYWVSKLYVFHMATKYRDLEHPIRPINNVGLVRPLKLDISQCFEDLTARFIRTRIAHQIASRMVRSVCIVFFEDLNELIELRKLYRQISSDPFYYHTDCEYLTKSSRPSVSDKMSSIFGRLVTYLSVFEPNSELFDYPQLKMSGRTREQHYVDYSKNWKKILETIYTELYMPSGSHLLDVLRSRCKIAENNPQNEELLRECWNEYGVNLDAQQMILRYFIPPTSPSVVVDHKLSDFEWFVHHLKKAFQFYQSLMCLIQIGIQILFMYSL
ncbi:unnamed protein product [Schistosoma margrebowiei]|uniref:Fungal_trans domain-containing protein n=2 Tax=Schistosoma margrebowiei TaxID=48269 RepID=A0AA85A094_9TREM|nr:unnamed protein product [Schistosoma margrebowiei]